MYETKLNVFDIQLPKCMRLCGRNPMSVGLTAAGGSSASGQFPRIAAFQHDGTTSLLRPLRGPRDAKGKTRMSSTSSSSNACDSVQEIRDVTQTAARSSSVAAPFPWMAVVPARSGLARRITWKSNCMLKGIPLKQGTSHHRGRIPRHAASNAVFAKHRSRNESPEKTRKSNQSSADSRSSESHSLSFGDCRCCCAIFCADWRHCSMKFRSKSNTSIAMDIKIPNHAYLALFRDHESRFRHARIEGDESMPAWYASKQTHEPDFKTLCLATAAWSTK